MTTDAKSKGCNDGGSSLPHGKLTEGKIAVVFASLSLQLRLLLQDTRIVVQEFIFDMY